MERTFAAAGLALLLGGCATTPAVYNPSNVPRTELAAVEMQDELDYFALVTEVFDAHGRRLVGAKHDLDQDRWKGLEIEPGSYEIVTFCNQGGFQAYVRVAANLGAGRRYHLACTLEMPKGIKGFFLDAPKMHAALTEVGGLQPPRE
jgi:hypothetical protein